MIATITTVSTFGLMAGVAGGVGFQILHTARIAFRILRARLRSENPQPERSLAFNER